MPPSPTPSGLVSSSDTEDFGGKENRKRVPQGKVARLLPQFDVAKGASAAPKALTSAGGYDVSDATTATTKALTTVDSDAESVGHSDAKGLHVDHAEYAPREVSEFHRDHPDAPRPGDVPPRRRKRRRR